MSAPKEGRQSPSPEDQTGAQQQSAPGTGNISDKPSSGNQEESQKSVTDTLESNPKGPLEDAAKSKA